MASRFMDFLESRSLLSGVGDDLVLAVDPGISEQGVMMPMTAATRVVSTVKKGFYSSKMTIDGIKGNVILQVSTVGTGTFAGTLKSADWGAFSVTISGMVSNGAVTFSGKNTYTQIKSFKGTISGSTLSGKLSIVQNGLSVSGNFVGAYAKTAPAMGNVVEPNMKGTYVVKASDGAKITMTITTQVDGKISGMVDGDKIRGVVLSDGRFKMITKESDGYTIISGKRNSNGSLTGEWEWFGNDGDNEDGTFTATKK